jgi:hypothetical protein
MIVRVGSALRAFAHPTLAASNHFFGMENTPVMKPTDARILHPAVRKDFWEFLIARHPIEEDYAKSTRQPYRWRVLSKQRLVVVQFVSQGGVGVFLRGERGTNPDEVEARLQPYEAQLKRQLGAERFCDVKKGTPPAKYFFQKSKGFESSIQTNWGRMADWLHKEANAYEAVVRRALAG